MSPQTSILKQLETRYLQMMKRNLYFQNCRVTLMSVIRESHPVDSFQPLRLIKGRLFVRDFICNVSRKSKCSSFLWEQSVLQTFYRWLLLKYMCIQLLKSHTERLSALFHISVTDSIKG